VSKKEQIAAREIIIHGLATPVDKHDKVAEAILINDSLDELKTRFLGPQGVNIDIEKDIVFHERIVGHHDAKSGYQPVKIRFRNQTFCEKVKKAASAAGALNGRRKMRWGKYRLPKILDEKGIPIKEDQKVLDMHNSRPDKLFFRASITKEKRDELRIKKEEREVFKKTEGYQRIVEAKKEIHDTRVNYGKIRNFEKCDLDIRAAR
jgi:acid phosphatase class B